MKLSSPLILQSAIFILCFYHSFCAPHSIGKRIKHQISAETVENPATGKDDYIVTTKGKEMIPYREGSENRIKDLVQEFRYLGADFTNSVESNKPNQTILIQVKAVWQHLVDSHLGISEYEMGGLKKEMARILFIAQERLCESPDATFFNEQCLHIGSTEYCPSAKMELVDGPDNNGFCDCDEYSKGVNGLNVIFSDQTSECYSQYTRGPCNVGEWFVLLDGIPQCESIPNECPDDGQHVYGTIDDKTGCWKIGQECSYSRTVTVLQGGDRVYLMCGLVAAYIPVSTSFYKPCRAGTRRNRNGDCLHGFFG